MSSGWFDPTDPPRTDELNRYGRITQTHEKLYLVPLKQRFIDVRCTTLHSWKLSYDPCALLATSRHAASMSYVRVHVFVSIAKELAASQPK